MNITIVSERSDLVSTYLPVYQVMERYHNQEVVVTLAILGPGEFDMSMLETIGGADNIIVLGDVISDKEVITALLNTGKASMIGCAPLSNKVSDYEEICLKTGSVVEARDTTSVNGQLPMMLKSKDLDSYQSGGIEILSEYLYGEYSSMYNMHTVVGLLHDVTKRGVNIEDNCEDGHVFETTTYRGKLKLKAVKTDRLILKMIAAAIFDRSADYHIHGEKLYNDKVYSSQAKVTDQSLTVATIGKTRVVCITLKHTSLPGICMTTFAKSVISRFLIMRNMKDTDFMILPDPEEIGYMLYAFSQTRLSDDVVSFIVDKNNGYINSDGTRGGYISRNVTRTIPTRVDYKAKIAVFS